MPYTKTPPATDGYYWWRNTLGEAIVRVKDGCAVTDSGQWLPVAELPGEWGADASAAMFVTVADESLPAPDVDWWGEPRTTAAVLD